VGETGCVVAATQSVAASRKHGRDRIDKVHKVYRIKILSIL